MPQPFLIPRILFVLFLLLPINALAGSFKVIPIKLFLDAKTKTALLTVTNDGEEKVTLQLEAMEWSQGEKGEDIYVPTNELIFFPKIFSMEKNEERIVRVGYQGTSGAREKTYRLYLKELPVSKPGEVAVKMALRLGVPVFISPTKEVQERMIQKMELIGGRLQIYVRNNGTSHFVVSSIRTAGLGPSEDEGFYKEIGGWYVLSGATRIFSMDIPEKECQQSMKFKASVKVESTLMEAKLDTDKAQCSKSEPEKK